MKDWKNWHKWIFIGFIILLLILNTVLLARNLQLFLLPGEITPLEKAKQGAYTVVEYSQNLAASLAVEQSKPVRDILANFKYEVERAQTPEDVGRLMIDYGRNVQDVIFRELQNKREDILLQTLSEQESLQQVKEANITISFTPDNELKIVDSESILDEAVIKAVKNNELLRESGQVFEVAIENGKVMIITPRTLFDRVSMLERQLANLRSQLTQLRETAGYNEISGPGIVVKVFDSAEGVTSEQIVHDSDIRDLVNELFAAGATGVEVGDQRLVATSSIRCAGPTILVNQQPIPVNPIVIKAVGSPRILASSLDIKKRELKLFGVDLSVEEKEKVTLVGYNVK
ncbi:MAG: DUF881 domain-containing protein [Halanaerobium sp.]|nr:DUF881 domain-containing protein [Halanaerobium sp.]